MEAIRYNTNMVNLKLLHNELPSEYATRVGREYSLYGWNG
jgi:hypothetical protein